MLGLLLFVASSGTESSFEVSRINFGSCNCITQPQPIWDVIASRNPDVWVWIGDAVYPDERMIKRQFEVMGSTLLKQHFDTQLEVAGYRSFVNQIKSRDGDRLLGVWDDHDYGQNDGDTHYPHKEESQQLYLDFLGVAKDSPRRDQRGLYSSQTYGPPGRKVKVILLDNRYFRGDLVDGEPDMLGYAQWAWLEEQLAGSDAQVHVVASGLQFLPVRGKLIESWAKHPSSKARLLNLFRKYKPAGLIFISGDVHMAELLCADLGDSEVIVEATSSGLSHSWGIDTHWTWPFHWVQILATKLMPSRHQIGDPKGYFVGLNFGEISVDWIANVVSVKIIDRHNVTQLEQSIYLHKGGPQLTCRTPNPDFDFYHAYISTAINFTVYGLTIFVAYIIAQGIWQSTKAPLP